MPKKPPIAGSDDPTASMDKPQRKSERSHEENQERAYIAASRRADRSIEARVQSARMASGIHKKRTGKGFRVTEEIVMKEEMYEEEEDDLPRSYRLLGSHMQTESPELNSRVEAYLSNKVAMSALIARTNDEWRENEINRLFAQSFPNAGQHAQQLSQGIPGPMFNTQVQNFAERPVFQSVSYVPRRRDRTQSRTQSRSDAASRADAASRRDSAVSSLASIPGSNRDTPALTRATPSFDSAMAVGTPLDFGTSASAFTPELAPEAKMLMGGMGMDGGYGQAMYGQQFPNPSQYYDPSEMPGYEKPEEPQEPQEPQDAMLPGGNYFGDDPAEPLKWDPSMTEEAWKAFIDDTAWTSDQQ